LSFPHYFCLNDTATTHIYTLSLHDALPIYLSASNRRIFAKILWKVPIQRFLASLAPTIFEIRFFISRAALLVNVNAKILNGSTPCDIKYAIRKVSTRVLPEPAPAITIIAPSFCNTGARWASLSCSKYFSKTSFSSGCENSQYETFMGKVLGEIINNKPKHFYSYKRKLFFKRVNFEYLYKKLFMDSIFSFLGQIPWWAWVLFVLLLVAIRDVFFNKRHTVSHNFPIVGHFRYMLESIGPELRQYIVANNREELPFNRIERGWIYASAKNENNYEGFGSDRDFYEPNYIFINNSMLPFKVEKDNPNYKNPYF